MLEMHAAVYYYGILLLEGSMIAAAWLVWKALPTLLVL